MATSIADLFVLVTSDVSGALSGLTSVDQKVNGTSASMAAAAPAGYALAGAATAVGAAFLASINTAADFEHQINGIKSVMSPTEVQEFGGAVEALALSLGKDTVFSASQAADAIETMIKAGVPLPAILGGAARSALDLAAATGTDVTLAAELASTAMNTFHLSADALPGIMDTISNISNATATSVDQLKFALAAVGPVAAGIGISFNDTAEALGIFANNGLQGSDAGTSLKTMLLNLEPSTARQVDAFKELGIITADGTNQFFDATGSAKSMRDIFEILKTSTANLTNEQKINLLQTAFGTDAVRAATIAAGEGAAGWDEVSASMDKMGGTAVAAAQRNSGLAGSMQALGGSFETIQIQVGKLFLPVLTQVIDGVTSLLNGFLTLDPGIQTTIVAIVGIAGAAAGLLAGFILLGPVIGAVGTAFGIILSAAAAAAVPIIALVAVGAALYEAWQTDFGGIREVTDQVWQAMQPAFANIQQFATTLIANIGPAIDGVRAAVAPFVTALSNDLTPILARLPDLIRLIGDGFNALSGPAQAIVSIIQILATGNYNGGIFGLDVNSGVVQFFIGLHDAIVLFFDAVLKLLNGDFSGAWDSFWHAWLGLLQTVFTAQGQILQTIGGAIVSFLQAIPGWIAQNAPGMWQAFLDELGQLPGQLQPYWDAFTGWLRGVLSGVPGFIGSNLGNLWGALVQAFGDLVPQLGPAWNGFAGWLGAVLGGIAQFVGDHLGDIWPALVSAFGGLVDMLSPAWDSFAGWFGSVLGGIPQFVGDMAGDIWAALRAAFEGLADQLSPAWDSFAGWFGAVLGGIPQFVGDMAGDVWAALRAAFEGLADQLAPAWDVFAGWLGAVLGGIPQFVGDNMGDVWVALSTAFGGLADTLSPLWDAFAGWFLAVLQGLPQFVIDNIGDVFGGIVQQAGDLVQRIATAIDPIRQLIADTFGNVWNWVTSGGTAVPGGGGGATTPPEPVPTGGAGSTGPLISIGTVNIGSQAEMDQFLQQMADVLLASARRVSAPAPG